MNRGYYVPCAPFLYFVPDSGGTAQTAVAGAAAALDVRPQQPPSPGGPNPIATSAPSGPQVTAAPFQYLIHEQAKSLVALQELQNEVGALLEFRELVIETFPHLRSKISSASSTMGSEVNLPEASSSSAPITPSTALVGPGWGPGVRVRRRIVQPKEAPRGTNASPLEDSSAEMTKMPSKGPKSSEGAASCSTVQDSGFSTETKEHHSNPSVKGAVNADASMDELWNLLDVIQRKGCRLRDEVQELQSKLQNEAVRGGGGEGTAADDWSPPPGVRSWGEEEEENPGEIRRLRMERDVLLDKVTEMEAETLQSRARVSQLQAELRQISSIRRGLEDQLLLSARNSCVCSLSSSTSPRRPPKVDSPRASSQVRERSSGFQPVRSLSGPSPRRRRSRRDSASSPLEFDSRIPRYVHRPSLVGQSGTGSGSPGPNRPALGALDHVIGKPEDVSSNLPPAFKPSPHKVAAILGESNHIELQRHLLTTVVHNEALQIELEKASLRKNEINGELERVREENDELRFQLEERSIELEGTRARVRVLERHHSRSPKPCLDTTPRPKRLLPGDDPILMALHAAHNSSSTESAHDLNVVTPPPPEQRPPEPPKRQNNKPSATHNNNNNNCNNKKQPSRIPLQTGSPEKGKKSGSAGSLGRSSLKNKLGGANLSLKSSKESLASSNLSRSKDSLNKLGSLPRKGNSSLPRPNNSPTHKKSTTLDATKEASSSLSSVPMVEVALCPADSLNMSQCRKLQASTGEEELTPWQGASMAFSYFDSINSEQLWQRHSTSNGDSLEEDDCY